MGLVHEGDRIRVDLPARRLELLIDESEMEERRSAWVLPEPSYRTGALAKYAKLVGSAEQGAVCD
jgi:dihydroxy-acid dehydratase